MSVKAKKVKAEKSQAVKKAKHLAKVKKTTKKAPTKKKISKKTVVKKKSKQQTPAKKTFIKTVKKISAKKSPVSRSAPLSAATVGAQLILSGILPYQLKKTEKYMSLPMRAHFRKVLMAWRDQLIAEADRTVNQMRGGLENLADLNDRATVEEEFTMELRARDRERKLIKKIEEVLASIDEGQYGYCEECGEEIGLRRLEARPTATLCVDCKELDEIREKQEGA